MTLSQNPEVPRSEWDHSEEEKYGLGGARETSKFYEVIGIDVVKKTTQRHLCEFVHEQMHNKFMKYLIEYSHFEVEGEIINEEFNIKAILEGIVKWLSEYGVKHIDDFIKFLKDIPEWFQMQFLGCIVRKL